MSFIERLNLLCPLFGVSFKRGSPVYHYLGIVMLENLTIAHLYIAVYVKHLEYTIILFTYNLHPS